MRVALQYRLMRAQILCSRAWVALLIWPVLNLSLLAQPATEQKQPLEPRYEKDIRAFEAADKTNPPPQDAILFVGSSSIRLWTNLAAAFPGHKVLNRGFGGSHLSDSVTFVDRIVTPYKPKLVLLYAGDNDIASGKSPEQISVEKEQFFGADILAAFYRRSAWDAVNGLNSAIKGQLAGVDLALALHFADLRCTSEPDCRIYVELDDVVGAGRLGGGRAAERLFWTWASRMGWLRALSGHAVLLIKECLESVVRPSTLINLCGRAWEAFRFPMHKRARRTAVGPSTTSAHPIAPPHFAARQRRQSVSYADKQ